MPQFGTTFIKADGGKNPQSAPVAFNEKNDGGRKAGSAHVRDNMKNDGGRNQRFAPA